MSLILRELNENDERAFLEGQKEWIGEDPHWYSFIWKKGMTFQDMLSLLDKERKGIELAPGRVPHTMLYAFVEGTIVGRLSVRHRLNENLERRGGHIGYAVAPGYRKKGYATEIVRQGLEYCKSLGLDRIMITCSDDNIPSWKIIEKFGGHLQDRVWDDVEKETIRRYWCIL